MGCFMEKINIDSNNNEPPKAKEKKVAKKTEKPNGCKNFRYFVQYGRDNNEDACNDADVTLATPLVIGQFYLFLVVYFFVFVTLLKEENL